jgi:hypothetical protein
VALYFHFPNTPSWCGPQLEKNTGPTLPLKTKIDTHTNKIIGIINENSPKDLQARSIDHVVKWLQAVKVTATSQMALIKFKRNLSVE